MIVEDSNLHFYSGSDCRIDSCLVFYFYRSFQDPFLLISIICITLLIVHHLHHLLKHHHHLLVVSICLRGVLENLLSFLHFLFNSNLVSVNILEILMKINVYEFNILVNIKYKNLILFQNT